MTDKQTVQAYADAWTHSIEAISELVAPLPEGAWNRPTECPGWSVRDVVSHVIAMESELLGDPRPIHTLPRDLRHVVDEFTRYCEVPVDKRRCHTAVEMASELEYTIIRRGRALRTNTRYEPTDEIRWPMGPYSRDVPYHQLLRTRVFDVWTHEQDIRRALGRPGNLDTAAAVITRDYLVEMLPRAVAKLAGAPAGSTAVFDIHGELEFMRSVHVDADGRGRVDGEVLLAPSVRITTDWETFARMACGRLTAPAAGVKAEGDEELAARILDNFAVTP